MATEIAWEQIGRGDPRLFGAPRHHVGKGEYRGLEFIEVEARTLINAIPEAAQLPFRWTINVYRGCSHACTYCFARPTHEFLGMDAGRDFERRIVVKVNAVEVLRGETRPGRWAGESIAMGTNTDPYQPAEGKYRLTRGVVEVLTERRNPFSILTKSPLVLRDLDLLEAAAEVADVSVSFSIGTLDEAVWRLSEPGTAHPLRRVEAIARLRERGIRSGVLIAPVLPGLSDAPEQVEQVVKACLDAGATSVGALLLHLRPGVSEQYLPWLASVRPDRLASHREAYRDGAHDIEGQRRLSELVAEMVERHGGLPDTGDHRRSRPPAPSSAGHRPHRRSHQLRLGI